MSSTVDTAGNSDTSDLGGQIFLLVLALFSAGTFTLMYYWFNRSSSRSRLVRLAGDAAAWYLSLLLVQFVLVAIWALSSLTIHLLAPTAFQQIDLLGWAYLFAFLFVFLSYPVVGVAILMINVRRAQLGQALFFPLTPRPIRKAIDLIKLA
jgi:uncharacterized Tic20 family protein